MTTADRKGRSHESIINDTLARFLRERCSLSAVAETLHDGRRPDIIVRLSEGPVILETELEPALTVEADALSRLGMEIDGRRVQNVFAVTIPGRLRSTSQQHLYERMAGATLAGCGKICCLPRAENCPTINAVLSRVLNALFELDYHMPNAAETVEAPYTAAERLTFLPQPASMAGVAHRRHFRPQAQWDRDGVRELCRADKPDSWRPR